MDSNKAKPIGKERLFWNSNFFYGNNSLKWQSNVPNYQEIWYENIYDGIDLRYYINSKGLKYDFIVHPRANLSQIRVRYEGADKLILDDFGDLIICTKYKNIIDSKVIVYQNNIEGKNIIDSKIKMRPSCL